MKKYYFFGIIILAIVILVIVFTITANKKEEIPRIKEEEIAVDVETLNKTTMENTASAFFQSYFNYNSEAIKNKSWQNSVTRYVDIESLIPKNNELYNRLYDKDWQLIAMLNDNVYGELVSYEIVSSSKNQLIANVITKKNGDDDPESPYFQMIQTIKTNYTIKFTSNYKVYYLNHGEDIILDAGMNYANR